MAIKNMQDGEFSCSVMAQILRRGWIAKVCSSVSLIMRFKRAKLKVLLLGQNNPRYMYKLGEELT